MNISKAKTVLSFSFMCAAIAYLAASFLVFDFGWLFDTNNRDAILGRYVVLIGFVVGALWGVGVDHKNRTS